MNDSSLKFFSDLKTNKFATNDYVLQEKREGHEKMFRNMDANNDGYVDLEEIKAWWMKQDSSKSAMYAMEDLWGMDTNHDGKVSKWEWLNFMGGKVTDKQYRENIEIGKSALALKNLV